VNKLRLCRAAYSIPQSNLRTVDFARHNRVLHITGVGGAAARAREADLPDPPDAHGGHRARLRQAGAVRRHRRLRGRRRHRAARPVRVRRRRLAAGPGPARQAGRREAGAGSRSRPFRGMEVGRGCPRLPLRPHVRAAPAQRRDRNEPILLGDALDQGAKRSCRLLVNGKSHRAAVQVPAPSDMLDDGTVERRVRLVRPLERTPLSVDALPRPIRRPLPRRGRRRSPSFPPSARARSTLSPASCCRSGASCPTTAAASTACRPTTVSASSAARSRRPGSRQPVPRDPTSLLRMLSPR